MKIKKTNPIKTIVLIIAIISSVNLSAQTDWERWGKKENPYIKENKFIERDYALKGDNITDLTAKLLIDGYWFFISDLDGDNCPFYPTCSSFFLQSVKKTNIVQGALMFGDRFMRDANVFNRDKRYHSYMKGKLYDPPDNYLIDKKKVREPFVFKNKEAK